MTEPIYARIENDTIVQFPVTIDDMNTRNTPNDDYYRCYFPAKAERPIPKLEQNVVQKPRLIGNAVYVEEYLVTKTVEEMFQYLAETIVTVGENNEIVVHTELITPEIFEAFYNVISARVQADLDAFAQTRKYDNIKSLCGYVGSTDPKFAAEGVRGRYLQDTTWSTLTSYFEDVTAGEVPVPLSWEEVHHLLPPLTWDEPLP